jgi:hypothetical protein
MKPSYTRLTPITSAPRIRKRTYLIVIILLIIILFFTIEFQQFRTVVSSPQEVANLSYDPISQLDAEIVTPQNLSTHKVQLFGQDGARDAFLIIDHVCMHRELGLFIIAPEFLSEQNITIPAVNLRASEPGYDLYYRVPSYRIDSFTKLQHHYENDGYPSQVVLLRNTTLFVISPIFLEHYSHFLVNTAIGLTEMHARIYGNASAELADSPITPPAWLKTSRHLLMKYVPQVAPPSDPLQPFNFSHIFRSWPDDLATGLTVCYDRAVIGMANICSVLGCRNMPNADLSPFQTMRRIYRLHYLDREEIEEISRWEATGAKQPMDERPSVTVVQRPHTRAIINLPEIEALLKSLALDYQVVYLDNYTISEQIRLFSHTRVMITNHGNAIGNLHWMPPNSLIIEAWAYGWNSSWFQWITENSKKELQIHHEIIKCTDLSCVATNETSPSFKPKDRAVAIDVNQLRTILLKYGYGKASS